MNKMIDCGMNMVHVGYSAMQVFCHAMGDSLADSPLRGIAQHQKPWTDLAEHTEVLLVKFEGKPWHEAASEFYTVFRECLPADKLPPWDDLPVLDRLAFEAVSRHLTWLFDLDEGLDAGDLTAAEVRYGAWAQNRLNKERTTE